MGADEKTARPAAALSQERYSKTAVSAMVPTNCNACKRSRLLIPLVNSKGNRKSGHRLDKFCIAIVDAFL